MDVGTRTAKGWSCRRYPVALLKELDPGSYIVGNATQESPFPRGAACPGRYRKKDNRLLVKWWVGCSPDESSWEPKGSPPIYIALYKYIAFAPMKTQGQRRLDCHPALVGWVAHTHGPHARAARWEPPRPCHAHRSPTLFYTINPKTTEKGSRRYAPFLDPRARSGDVVSGGCMKLATQTPRC